VGLGFKPWTLNPTHPQLGGSTLKPSVKTLSHSHGWHGFPFHLFVEVLVRINCLCFKGCHCLGCFPPHASKSACNELICERVFFVSARQLLVVFAVDMFIDLQLMNMGLLHNTSSTGGLLEIGNWLWQRPEAEEIPSKAQVPIHSDAFGSYESLVNVYSKLERYGHSATFTLYVHNLLMVFDPLICSCELELKSRVMDTWWF